MNNPKKSIVHHTGVSRKRQPRQFFAINRYHRDAKDKDGLPLYHYGKPTSMGYYGAYQILIEPDGSEWRYRRDWEVGVHTRGQNDVSLGIALAGNFDLELPTEAQIKTLIRRLKKWNIRYNIEEIWVVPHRRYSPKSCYGSLLSDEWAQNLLQPVEMTIEDIKKNDKMEQMKTRLDALRAIILRLQIIIKKLYENRL